MKLIIVAHDLRSAYNVGSLLRTADGLGIQEVLLSGYTPYPEEPDDSRLPHERRHATRQIHKTALGAESSQPWRHVTTIMDVLENLKQRGYTICALEQVPGASDLPRYRPSAKLVLIVGNEINGLQEDIMSQCDLVLQIPMFGAKESFNVAQAAAIAMYHCRFAAP